MKPAILFEDNHLIAVEKPAGMLTQDDYSGQKSLMTRVKEYIREKYNKPGNVFLAMVHRLDRPVSGIVLFAKTSKGAARINEQFRNRSVLKIYTAEVIKGRGLNTSEGWHTAENTITRERDISHAGPPGATKGQQASLRYRVIEAGSETAFVMIELTTGRKHQIRAQFAALSSPVAGDFKYGYTGTGKQEEISLHSCFMGFIHPTNGSFIEIRSEIPRRIIPEGLNPGRLKDKLDSEIDYLIKKI